MPDKYDEQIERLKKKPNLILVEWGNAKDLYQMATPTRDCDRPDGKLCGCLTMIRGDSGAGSDAWTDELTQAIRADNRIPVNACDITVADLPIFAEWQRRLDRELART